MKAKSIGLLVAAVAWFAPPAGLLQCPAQEGAFVTDRVRDQWRKPDGYRTRLTGKVTVIDANTLAFDDGTRIVTAGGMDAPDLEQLGLIDDKFYPCGREAAEFLRNLIGDRPVSFYAFGERLETDDRNRLRGATFVGDTGLDAELVRNGWALAHHSGMALYEVHAREQKRGLWRGEFVIPEHWRNGQRLPGETEAARPLAESQNETPIVVMDGAQVVKISGIVKVLDAHTLEFGDGSVVELNGGMDAPDLGQPALLGEVLYPWGRHAADFLKGLIGSRGVTCYVEGRHGAKLRGACFVDESMLEIEMVRNGWAVSHHTALDGWQMLASENQRGVWRGKFIAPERWRKGERLPGEPVQDQAEREALASLQAFEPRVTFDESMFGRPVIALQFPPNTARKMADDDLRHVAKFNQLRSLDVPSAPAVTDAGLTPLAELRGLVALNVNWTKVTAAGLTQWVKGRRTMTRLEVAGVAFHDSDLTMLAGLPNLQELSLRATEITDLGLESLRTLDQLRRLSLMNTRVGDAGMEHLRALANLEDLDLDRTKITDDALVHVASLVNLRRLQIAHTAITDAGLDHLATLADLKELNARATHVTQDGVDQLQRKIPGLRVGFGPAPE
jgi:endonuclease YncB( thermonuclease family)